MKMKDKKIYFTPTAIIAIFIAIIALPIFFNLPMNGNITLWEIFISFNNFRFTIGGILFIFMFISLILYSISNLYYCDVNSKKIEISHVLRKNINYILVSDIKTMGIYEYDWCCRVVNIRDEQIFRKSSIIKKWIFLSNKDIKPEYKELILHTGLLSFLSSTYYFTDINDKGYFESNDFFIWKMIPLIKYHRDTFIQLFGESAYYAGLDIIELYESENKIKAYIKKEKLLRRFYKNIYIFIKKDILFIPYNSYIVRFVKSNTEVLINENMVYKIYNKPTITILKRTQPMQNYLLYSTSYNKRKMLPILICTIFAIIILVISLI